MKQYVETNSRMKASISCPWAAIIERVHRGYMCFSASNDYLEWLQGGSKTE